MNVRITFRHMDASDAVKQHARQKLDKLQKFLREPMTAKVTLSLNSLEHVAEIQIASGSVRHEASEASDDMYTSIDRVMSKLERQIRGAKGAKQAKKKRSGATLRGGKKPLVASQPVASAGSGTRKSQAEPRSGKSSRKAPSAAGRRKKAG